MNTPSKAAMRAAEQIVLDHAADTSDTCSMSAELLAEAIDRETGLPELIACLREARKLDALGSKEANAEWRNFRTEKYGCEIVRIHARIDAALASIGDDE